METAEERLKKAIDDIGFLLDEVKRLERYIYFLEAKYRRRPGPRLYRERKSLTKSTDVV